MITQRMCILDKYARDIACQRQSIQSRYEIIELRQTAEIYRRVCMGCFGFLNLAIAGLQAHHP